MINTIAGWISNFFEAHSPPKAGPLRSIDKWGTNLMNTYLNGFLLADFSILSDVGGMMQDAFSIFEDLGQIGEGSANGLFAGVRQSLAQVIEIFNQTGEIAEGVLDKIASGLGEARSGLCKTDPAGSCSTSKFRSKFQDLENKKKQTLKNYDAEIARISKLNVSAEEKAELMRQAMAQRDDELEQTNQQDQAAQDQADQIKVNWIGRRNTSRPSRKLWHCWSSKRKRRKRARVLAIAGALGMFSGITPTLARRAFGGGLNNVKDMGEEMNAFAVKVQRQKGHRRVLQCLERQRLWRWHVPGGYVQVANRRPQRL